MSRLRSRSVPLLLSSLATTQSVCTLIILLICDLLLTMIAANWSISGNINDVSLTTILNMYEDLFGSILLDNPQDYNIVFNSICLVIGSEGFFLQGTVTVNGPTSTSATISIAKNGISIGGAVGDLELFDGLVKIHEAELDVFIGRAIPEARSRDIKVAVSGHVTIKDLIIKAGLYYVRNAAGENQYTVYGEISGALKLRQLCSELQGTFLDVELTNIAFFVSNQDTPAVGALNSMKYPIKKGRQQILCEVALILIVYDFQVSRYVRQSTISMG